MDPHIINKEIQDVFLAEPADIALGLSPDGNTASVLAGLEAARERGLLTIALENGFFRTMNVPLVRGRFFTEREMREKSNVVIVSESLARTYFPNQDPLGKQLAIYMTDPIVPTEISRNN